MSEEIDTAGFLSGFSATAVLEVVTAVLEASISVLADEIAEERLDIAEETAADPESDGTPGLGATGNAAAGWRRKFRVPLFGRGVR